MSIRYLYSAYGYWSRRVCPLGPFSRSCWYFSKNLTTPFPRYEYKTFENGHWGQCCTPEIYNHFTPTLNKLHSATVYMRDVWIVLQRVKQLVIRDLCFANARDQDYWGHDNVYVNKRIGCQKSRSCHRHGSTRDIICYLDTAIWYARRSVDKISEVHPCMCLKLDDVSFEWTNGWKEDRHAYILQALVRFTDSDTAYNATSVVDTIQEEILAEHDDELKGVKLPTIGTEPRI